jgi:hypothetical protein
MIRLFSGRPTKMFDASHMSVAYVRKILQLICRHFSSSSSYFVVILFFFFSRLYNPSGFRPAQLSLSILSRKVLQSAVASGTSNPQLGGESGI